MLRWKIPSVLPFAALISMFALLSVFFACRNLSNDRVAKHGPFTQPAMEMFEYVKEHSSPDSIIVFRKPRVMRLFTGRSSLRYNKQEDFKYFDMVVIDKKSLYGQIATTDLDKVLISHPGKLVFVNDGFEIYEFVKNQ